MNLLQVNRYICFFGSTLFCCLLAKAATVELNKNEIAAIKMFENCIKHSGDYFPQPNSSFCGAVISSKSSAENYLSCVRSKKYKPDRVEEYEGGEERVLTFKCTKSYWIEVSIVQRQNKSVVASIGLVLP